MPDPETLIPDPSGAEAPGSGSAADAAAPGAPSGVPSSSSAPAAGSDAAAPGGSQDGAPAGNTSAKAEEPPKTALEAALRATAKAEQSRQAGGAKDGQNGALPGVKAGDKPGAKPDDGKQPPTDGKDAPARIQALLGEKKTLTERVTALEPKAQSFDQLNDFCVKHKVSGEDVTFGLALMAAVRSDPVKALEMIQPMLEHVRSQAGEVVPPDLQARVDSGEISQAAAQELARTRARADLASGRAAETQADRERDAQRVEQERAVQQRQILATNVGTAVSNYEAQWKATDPDYEKKHELVGAQIHALWAKEGLPTTPEQAVDQTKRARAAVEANLKKIVPFRGPTDMPTGGGRPAVHTNKPATATDAVLQSLGMA